MTDRFPPQGVPNPEEIKPITFLSEEVAMRIREEVGEAWLPASEHLARLQAIYGTDHHLIPPEESNALREKLPWVNDNPFVYDQTLMGLLASTDFSKVKEHAEHAMRLSAESLIVDRIWAEAGLDVELVSYGKREE